MSELPVGPFTHVQFIDGRWRDPMIVRALEDDRRAFEHTQNPCYVFEAIRRTPAHEDLPSWVRAYLAGAAERLRWLVFPGRGDVDMTPEAATDYLPVLFGFRGAANAIEGRRRDNDANGVFLDCAVKAADPTAPDNRKARLAGNAVRLGVSETTARRLYDHAKAMWSK